MLRGNKSENETRFELLVIGLVLVTAAALYVVFRKTLPSMILFIPGLILLGGAIFQDMQPDWKAGWMTYLLAIIVVATGLTGIVNSLLKTRMSLPWLVIAIVELGAVLIAKALYDPSV